MSENQCNEKPSALLTHWSDASSLGIVVVSGPRAILPADERRAAKSWWVPVAWLRSNIPSPARFQSRTVYRPYPSYSDTEDRPYLIRLADWDGAEDRRRLKTAPVSDLSLHASYSFITPAEWEDVERILVALEREAFETTARQMQPIESAPRNAASTDAKMVAEPQYKEFHRSSPYASATFSWSPTSRAAAAGDHWNAAWAALEERREMRVPAAELVERYEYPSFDEYIDVAADGLSFIARSFV